MITFKTLVVEKIILTLIRKKDKLVTSFIVAKLKYFLKGKIFIHFLK